jgi:hypothetical protein
MKSLASLQSWDGQTRVSKRRVMVGVLNNALKKSTIAALELGDSGDSYACVIVLVR